MKIGRIFVSVDFDAAVEDFNDVGTSNSVNTIKTMYTTDTATATTKVITHGAQTALRKSPTRSQRNLSTLFERRIPCRMDRASNRSYRASQQNNSGYVLPKSVLT
jgi:hypothetical protein